MSPNVISPTRVPPQRKNRPICSRSSGACRSYEVPPLNTTDINEHGVFSSLPRTTSEGLRSICEILLAVKVRWGVGDLYRPSTPRHRRYATPESVLKHSRWRRCSNRTPRMMLGSSPFSRKIGILRNSDSDQLGDLEIPRNGLQVYWYSPGTEAKPPSPPAAIKPLFLPPYRKRSTDTKLTNSSRLSHTGSTCLLAKAGHRPFHYFGQIFVWRANIIPSLQDLCSGMRGAAAWVAG